MIGNIIINIIISIITLQAEQLLVLMLPSQFVQDSSFHGYLYLYNNES